MALHNGFHTVLHIAKCFGVAVDVEVMTSLVNAVGTNDEEGDSD